MHIILLGPPGGGKGTQAQVLKEKYNLRHIGTGDIFRDIIKKKTPLGLKIKKYVESGELVPDEVVIEVLKDEIGKTTSGFVLDGFPRTLAQAEQLSRNVKIDKVFYFDTTEETIIKRLGGRRTCPKCGINYHIENMPPKKENICDTCGVELFKRKDDAPVTIHNRLKIYRNETGPLVRYYKAKELLITVNGNLSKDETFEIIKKYIPPL